jgi:hypothetical protein
MWSVALRLRRPYWPLTMDLGGFLFLYQLERRNYGAGRIRLLVAHPIHSLFSSCFLCAFAKHSLFSPDPFSTLRLLYLQLTLSVHDLRNFSSFLYPNLRNTLHAIEYLKTEGTNSNFITAARLPRVSYSWAVLLVQDSDLGWPSASRARVRSLLMRIRGQAQNLALRMSSGHSCGLPRERKKRVVTSGAGLCCPFHGSVGSLPAAAFLMGL